MADPANSVAVTAGSPVVTGSLTSFVAAEYDLFILDGIVGVVDSCQSPTQITLKNAWPGASQSAQLDWAIVNTGPYWSSTTTTNKRLTDLLTKWEAGAVKWDASGSLAGRDAYNNQPVNFTYLSVDPLPFTFFVKRANTNSASDWSAGQVIYQKADSTAEAEAAASAAQGYASDASGSATVSANSASASADSATLAGQQVTAATQQATNAANSATAASNSAGAAQTSANNAAGTLANAALKGDNADISRLRGVSNAGIDFWVSETALSAQGTVDLGGIATLKAALTLTGPVTSLGTGANRYRLLRFTNAGTLVNSTALVLPGGVNITTAAGMRAVAASDASGNWSVFDFEKADGSPIKNASIVAADITDASPNGRTLISAADYIAMRSLLGVADISAVANACVTLNGFFNLSQETADSTIVTSNGQYISDQWVMGNSGPGALTAQRIASPFPTFPGIPYGEKLTVTTAAAVQSDSSAVNYNQRIEGIRNFKTVISGGYNGPLSIAFLARPNVNLTSYFRIGCGNRAYCKRVSLVANTDNFLSFLIPADIAVSGAQNITVQSGNAQLFLAAGSAQFGAADGTWGATQIIGSDITNFMATVGNTIVFSGLVVIPGGVPILPAMLPLLARPVDDELRLCQRYYEKGRITFRGYATNGSSYGGSGQFTVTKRVNPGITSVNAYNAGFPVAALSATATPESYDLSRTANATGSAAYVDDWAANARM